MSGTEKYSIKRSNSYLRSLTSLLKDHYKHDKKARLDFKNLLDDVLTQLTNDPHVPGDQERWPKGTSRQGWQFRKARFNMPGLRGKCRRGRLMYLIDLENCVVIPLIVYTHEEEPTRPSEGNLKRMIEEHTLQEDDT